MKDIVKCIENLRIQLENHRKGGLKETATREIFINPLLGVLGWNVSDTDKVELELTTVDGKSVDYAMSIKGKYVFVLEAKQLGDVLDVKCIAQVVGYATNNGIEWCVLTNGVRYKVYKATENTPAPKKLLFEVSIDPRDSEGLSVDQIAAQLSYLSRDSIDQGALDKLGTETFTTRKVKMALDRLFDEPRRPFIHLIRKTLSDSSVTPSQIQQALHSIWDEFKSVEVPAVNWKEARNEKRSIERSAVDYSESHHTERKPSEVVELYRALDRVCQDLAPGRITRSYKAKYVRWSLNKAIFCCARLKQDGLRVWVKTDPKTLDPSVSFAKDVSRIGHWGVGNVELAIDSLGKLPDAAKFLRQSFDNATRKRM